MATPRVCVLRAPGTNCDAETAYAFERCGGKAERVHAYRLLETPDLLKDFQIVCVPGGFSYGDDIGAGVIFSRQLRGRLGGAMTEFLQADKLLLGICNGFQVLLKAGLLPGGSPAGAADSDAPMATLTWNDNGRYTAVWVHVKATAPQCVFLRGIDELDLPVAHAEGKVVFRDDAVLQRLRERNQIALRYATQKSKDGSPDETLPYPDNPNGSTANIAGLCDATGRVLGLMPHPERFIHATQHPQWTRLGLKGDGEGLKVFRNAVEYFG